MKYEWEICMGLYKDEPFPISMSDQMQIFYRTCKMKQEERSLSKVNEYEPY